ncbi:MAG TPA: response regulator [Noviherbaspirillum sp.]|uniref:response regulator transcription factor n=1 Tax=Noviherbaspirillum sp. TaxID=1926288 RepID=UPI002D6EDB81|nr:response regulator [Noviherbaspirillum sp.]HYD96834.1 response regulator [Noviherbaspirillum sp.]
MGATRKELTTLIADDDATTRAALRLLLREHGCQVVAEAQDGERAVELCAAHRPHIAFIDINMPRLDGHAAAQRIRLNSPAVSVIMVTGLATMDNVQRALQAGVSGFVVKPFNAMKVGEAIAHCMKQKR